MRIVFGVLSLLIVVAIIGMLARTQLKSVASVPALPSVSGAAGNQPAPTGTVREQAKSVQDQYKADVNKALQMPADRASELSQ